MVLSIHVSIFPILSERNESHYCTYVQLALGLIVTMRKCIHTLGPSKALGGERGERFERVIAFYAIFHFN